MAAKNQTAVEQIDYCKLLCTII